MGSDSDSDLHATSPASFYRQLTGLPQPQPESASAGKVSHVQEVKYGIRSGNVGYKLLKKAGWKEGAGLGPEGKGRTEPLEAWFNRGRRGVGCEDQKKEPNSQKSTPASLENLKGGHALRETKDSCGKEKEEAEKAAKRRRREAAVHRAFFTECKEADMEMDSNPLTRGNRLSHQNPLLDD